jgi:anti-anti-sigma factor
MNFSIQEKEEGMRVSLSGQFTFNDDQKFRHLLEKMHAQMPRFLELDFAEANFIYSAGLGMLLLLRDSCQHKHIPISIHSIKGQVEKIFLISKFDQLFSIKP